MRADSKAGKQASGIARWAIIVAMLSLGKAVSLHAQQRLNERRAVAPDATIRIVNPSGSVRLLGWNRDTVAVSGTVGDEPGKFFIDGTDRTLKLGVTWPEGARAEASDLEVHVPARSRIWVTTNLAEIEVEGVTGSLVLSTVEGRIRVAGAPREVDAESIDGGIEIAGDAMSVRAKTAGGTIVLRGVIRESEASTISGPLLVGMTGKIARTQLQTLSGEIAFKGDLERGGSLEANTHSGDVELRLPADLGADFDLTAYGGEIRNELGGKGPASPDKHGELHFVTGDGNARVIVRTFKGKVVVKRK